MTQQTAPRQALWQDFERCYRAVASRETRFDGQFITGVRTTGIYCRPSCPAQTPLPGNVEFFPTSAAAQAAGFRACRRCLPDAVPGSPEWNLRADLAARAMRLITDGVVEREGVPGLATRLGYSERQLGRALTTELGAGPLALARAHRAHTARLLIERTSMSLSDVAFAAGFASVRQFNATMREVFATTPSRLRGTRRTAPLDGAAPNGAVTLRLRLPARTPFDGAGVLDFLAARAVAGVESVADGEYARALRLPHGSATARLRPAEGHVDCTLRLTDTRDIASAVNRLRRLFDLDADPAAIDATLRGEPLLVASVDATPGIRLPGSVDGAETLVRAMLGQQVTVAAARTAAERLCATLGEPLAHPDGELTTLFPTPAAIAEHGAEVLTGPARRVESIAAVSAALAAGALDVHLGRDPAELREELLAQPGIGPWTADYLLLRVLGSPDVLLTGDLALRTGAEALNLPADPTALTERMIAVRPWRSYAGMHLWRAAGVAKGFLATPGVPQKPFATPLTPERTT
ncbi:AlkA N-terminal domain-containing protein [Haloechinothrix halophila]|uniref:AlkA N-terminal domain-containing protein n=1 Tax=Haloechinothrix halophila TaxID=1069073 RepID=UPI000411A1B1|nr:AlkA N-terminal domain-containing protein [Haloechinothrix halophila]